MYTHLKTVVRPEHVADNLNKIANNYWIRVSHVNFLCIYTHLKMVVRPKHVADNLNKIINNYWNRVSHVNLRYINSHLKMVVRPKHVADNLNKIVYNYWNSVALDVIPWTYFCDVICFYKCLCCFVRTAFETVQNICCTLADKSVQKFRELSRTEIFLLVADIRCSNVKDSCLSILQPPRGTSQ
jgi:hypothetical protein